MGTYSNKDWNDAYERNNIGGLLGASLSSLGGFGKFLLTIFALSTVASNILNIYSLSLSTQVIAPIFKRIPRFIYTFIGTGIYILLSILAANRFNDSLISFTDVVSYWFSIYIVIVFEEHLIFRRCSYKNYDFNIWNDRKILPIRLSAILSGLIGIVGIALGMSQTWFTGPVSRAIAANTDQVGIDIGFEFGFIFTAITFPPFRLIELYFEKKNNF
jgi:purine-cytosine permease-like protein